MKRSIIEIITGRLRKETRVLLVSSNIWYLGEGMFGPFLAVFTQKIGGNIMDIAWAWAIFLFTTGIITMVTGRISDNLISKRILVIIGYGLNALFTFSYLLIQSPLHLFLVQVGLGFAAACAAPTWEALYSSYHKEDQVGYEWGLASGQAQVYTAAGILIGGAVLHFLSFTVLFIIMGVVQVLATFIQAIIFKYPNDAQLIKV